MVQTDERIREHDAGLTLRAPHELLEALRELSRRRYRTVGAEVRMALAEHLERERERDERDAAHGARQAAQPPVPS